MPKPTADPDNLPLLHRLSDMTNRVFNFSPGPAVLPSDVLTQVRDELLSLPGLGMSVLEISHRSSQFKAIHAEAQANLRTLLNVPENYHVLFLQGGSRLQFSMIPMNLAHDGQTAHYFVTGTWSKKAVEESQKIPSMTTDVICDFEQFGYDRLPGTSSMEIDPAAAYAYYCSNETVHGVQFQTEPNVGSVPLVCDASSDFLCRPLQIEKYGMLYACAQKNAGPAGLTIVILRDDLLQRGPDSLPGYLNYRSHSENDSMFNTPPTFAIYVLNLVAKWLINDVGGLEQMHARNREKANMLYALIDESSGFYTGHAQSDARSIMNVTFRLPNESLQDEFVRQAEKHNCYNLKGHRSVGGIRASIYNSMSVEGVATLRDFMHDFLKLNA